MAIRTQPKFLPSHVITEALGYFTLAGKAEYQLNIAEQLASYTYSDLNDFIGTLRGYCTRKFEKELKELKSSPFFQPYFNL